MISVITPDNNHIIWFLCAFLESNLNFLRLQLWLAYVFPKLNKFIEGVLIILNSIYLTGNVSLDYFSFNSLDHGVSMKAR